VGRSAESGHARAVAGSAAAAIILPPYVSDRDEKVRIVSGLQFTGTFDETKWFK